MNDLIDVVAHRTSVYECSDSGEWVRFRCPHGRTRYVVRSRLADGYQAWCQHEGELEPEWYPTAERAVAGPATETPWRVEETSWAA